MNREMRLKRAYRHGWRASGAAFLGGTPYAVLWHRNTKLRIAVHPMTNRVFVVR